MWNTSPRFERPTKFLGLYKIDSSKFDFTSIGNWFFQQVEAPMMMKSRSLLKTTHQARRVDPSNYWKLLQWVKGVVLIFTYKSLKKVLNWKSRSIEWQHSNSNTNEVNKTKFSTSMSSEFIVFFKFPKMMDYMQIKVNWVNININNNFKLAW